MRLLVASVHEESRVYPDGPVAHVHQSLHKGSRPKRTSRAGETRTARDGRSRTTARGTDQCTRAPPSRRPTTSASGRRPWRTDLASARRSAARLNAVRGHQSCAVRAGAPAAAPRQNGHARWPRLALPSPAGPLVSARTSVPGERGEVTYSPPSPCEMSRALGCTSRPATEPDGMPGLPRALRDERGPIRPCASSRRRQMAIDPHGWRAGRKRY